MVTSQYGLWARVNMCHRPLIELLADQLDASIIMHRKDLKNPKHRAAFEVSLYSNKASDFLASIYDELVIKQEEARVAIKFQGHLNAYKHKLTSLCPDELQAVMNYREAAKLQLQALKRGSFIGVSNWNVGELGEPPMPGLATGAEGQPRTKQELTTPGVRNEQVPTSKEKVCSELGGNVESAAEMTAPDKLRLVR